MFRQFLFTLFVLMLIGCEDKTDVIEPEVSPNRPPVIDRLILPDRIDANTPLELQVITRDADQDKLSIVWEVSEGTVDADVWTPPNRAAEVVISVHVSDGENPTVSQSKNVTVVKPVTVEPPTVEPPPIVMPPPPIVVDPPREPEPPPREPEVGEAWNITPGIGIEHIAPGQETIKVSIGDTTEQVSAVAEISEWVAEDSQVHFHPRLGEFHCLYEDGKTVLITIFDRRFKNREGISVGSHVDGLIEAYGDPDEMSENEDLTFYFYFARGYVFVVLDDELVVGITVA